MGPRQLLERMSGDEDLWNNVSMHLKFCDMIEVGTQAVRSGLGSGTGLGMGLESGLRLWSGSSDPIIATTLPPPSPYHLISPQSYHHYPPDHLTT